MAIFSRQHYIAIARVLREQTAKGWVSPAESVQLRLAFGDMLKKDNQSFNYDKFIAEIEKETAS